MAIAMWYNRIINLRRRLITMSVPKIVERNKDVEHIMHASCNWGLFAQAKRKNKLFAMLVTTDVHECTRQLSSAIEYLNYYDAIDCGVCLGDIQQSNYIKTDGTWYVNEVLKSKKPFLSVLGNHDVGNSSDAAISGTCEMAFDKFIRPTAPVTGIENLDKSYFVKYFDEYKIAFIGLDNYRTPTDKDENGNYIIKRGVEGTSQEQIDWLIETLGNIPEGYHVIIGMHSFPYTATKIKCAFTQEYPPCFNSLPQGRTIYGDDNIFTDIVDAWVNGDKLDRAYEPVQYKELCPTLTVKCDFSARGKGDFVAYVSGHMHNDIVFRSAKYEYQKGIVFAATATDNWQNYGSDLPRETDTKSEDAITVMSVNTDRRQIKLVRIGSDMTMEMTERKCMLIDY